MKKLVAGVVVGAMLLSIASCGLDSRNSKKTKTGGSKKIEREESDDEEASIEESSTFETEAEETTPENVDVTLMILDFSAESAEEYIANLQADHPDKTYKFYNDSYYTMTIDYEQYIDTCEKLRSYDEVEKILTDLYTDEDFDGAFRDVEYNNDLTKIKIYVDREKYEQNQSKCEFGAYLYMTKISDFYQAYNFIVPENRVYDIKIFDYLTKEQISFVND